MNNVWYENSNWSFCCRNYNVAPQFLHFILRMQKQHKMPIGNKQIAQQMPQQVKPFSMVPILQAGHPPIICGAAAVTTVTLCVVVGGGVNGM